MRRSFGLPSARWLAPPAVSALALAAGSTVALAKR
jgi:hypothetical protein